MIAAPPSTIAKPSRAWTGSLRFPSRYAATKPARKTLAVKVTKRPSTNDRVAARTQTAVGAPKLKRRRPSNRSGTTASAGAANQGDVCGASDESRLSATSTALSTAAITTRTSNAYVRARDQIRLMEPTYSRSCGPASALGRRTNQPCRRGGRASTAIASRHGLNHRRRTHGSSNQHHRHPHPRGHDAALGRTCQAAEPARHHRRLGRGGPPDGSARVGGRAATRRSAQRLEPSEPSLDRPTDRGTRLAVRTRDVPGEAGAGNPEPVRAARRALAACPALAEDRPPRRPGVARPHPAGPRVRRRGAHPDPFRSSGTRLR